MKVLIGTHISTKPQKSLTIEDVWDTVAREGSVSGSDTERQGSQRSQWHSAAVVCSLQSSYCLSVLSH